MNHHLVVLIAFSREKGFFVGSFQITLNIFIENYIKLALAGVAQWIECRPVNWKVIGSVLGQGTCLGCRPGT